jgi:hypothetical protein
MHFSFMDLRRGSKIEVDTNLPWPKSFSISREVIFCYENTNNNSTITNFIPICDTNIVLVESVLVRDPPVLH